MLRIGRPLCNYCCLSDGSNFWAHMHRDSRHWPKYSLLVRTFTLLVRNFAHETGTLFGWGFAGRIAMLLPSRVAGQTLGLRGPTLR